MKKKRKIKLLRSEITIYNKPCEAELKPSKAPCCISRQQPLPWLHPEAHLFVGAAGNISATHDELCYTSVTQGISMWRDHTGPLGEGG